MKILLVEDEEFIRELIRETLNSKGYEVTAVTNGLEGLAAIHGQGPFDVIFSDIKMAKMSGLEMHERLLADQDLHAARFIFMSGGYTAPEFEEKIRATKQPFLRKPFNSLNELFKAIDKIKT